MRPQALAKGLALEDDGAPSAAAARLTAGALIDRDFLDDQRQLLGARQIANLQLLLEETSKALVADIATAVAADDRIRLARSAHQLGSAASALGLVSLYEQCNAIEATAASMSPPSAAAPHPGWRPFSRHRCAHWTI